MATAVGLNFKMTASIAKFQASMNQVQAKLASLEKSGKETASGMKMLAGIEIGKLLLSGASKLVDMFKGGVSSVTGFANEARKATDAIGKLASATGFAHEPLQVLGHMADLSGVGFDNFAVAAKTMGKNLGDVAMGTGEAQAALQELGIDIQSLARLSPEQQFIKLGSAINGIEDPAKRSAVAAKIFGESGIALIPMFENIEQNAAKTAGEMLSLGMVLSKLQIQNVEAMNDSFTKVYKTAFSIGSQALANFAPAITRANEKLLEFIKNFEYQGLTGGQGLVAFATEYLQKIVVALAEAFDSFINFFSDAAASILDGIAGLSTGAAAVGSFLPGVSAEDTVGLTNLSLSASHAADRLKSFESNTADSVREMIAFANNLGSQEAALDEFKSGIMNNAAKTQASAETLSEWAATGLSSVSAMEDLRDGISSAAGVVPVDLRELGQAAAANAAALGSVTPIAELAAEKLGGLSTAPSLAVQGFQKAASLVGNALGLLEVAPKAAAAGVSGLASGFLDILAPLGFTRDKIIELGNAAAAHSNFKDKLISSAMAEWDNVAGQRLQMFLKMPGANPFALHHEMMKERAAYLKRVTGQVEAAENQWFRATGGLTGSLKITGDQVQAAGKVLGDKLGGAAESASSWLTGVTDWVGGLFGGGDGGDGMPEMPDPEETLPELQSQTQLLGQISDAAAAFGKAFAVAVF